MKRSYILNSTLTGEFIDIHGFDTSKFFIQTNKKFFSNIQITNNNKFKYHMILELLDSHDMVKEYYIFEFNTSFHKGHSGYFRRYIFIKLIDDNDYRIIVDLSGEFDPNSPINDQSTMVVSGNMPVNIMYDNDNGSCSLFVKSLYDAVVELYNNGISKEKNTIKLIFHDKGGFYTVNQEITQTTIDDLDLYYGDGFNNINQNIVNNLKSNNNGSIFILYGDSGTGKTTYLRHLISTHHDLDFVYLPVNMVSMLSEPGFFDMLKDLKNHILIIEESEDVVMDRSYIESNKNNVATILNLGDGLLTDVINLKVILTFNSEIGKIDPAIKRKGRLANIHEFKKISPSNANNIAKNNNIDRTFDTDVTLSDIFNGAEISNVETNSVGFFVGSGLS